MKVAAPLAHHGKVFGHSDNTNDLVGGHVPLPTIFETAEMISDIWFRDRYHWLHQIKCFRDLSVGAYHTGDIWKRMKQFMDSVDTNKRALGLFEERHFYCNDHEEII